TQHTIWYSLSLHDALPIWSEKDWDGDRFIDKFFIDADGNVDLYIVSGQEEVYYDEATAMAVVENLNNPRITSAKIDSLSDIAFTDRKSTRLNSSHVSISYA